MSGVSGGRGVSGVSSGSGGSGRSGGSGANGESGGSGGSGESGANGGSGGSGESGVMAYLLVVLVEDARAAVDQQLRVLVVVGVVVEQVVRVV